MKHESCSALYFYMKESLAQRKTSTRETPVAFFISLVFPYLKPQHPLNLTPIEKRQSPYACQFHSTKSKNAI